MKVAISYPPLHEKGGRMWWNGIYGMTDKPLAELVKLARSWNRPPAVKILGPGYRYEGYDRGQRAFVIARTTAGKAGRLVN